MARIVLYSPLLDLKDPAGNDIEFGKRIDRDSSRREVGKEIADELRKGLFQLGMLNTHVRDLIKHGVFVFFEDEPVVYENLDEKKLVAIPPELRCACGKESDVIRAAVLCNNCANTEILGSERPKELPN